MAWVMNTSWCNSEYISFFKAIFFRNLVTPIIRKSDTFVHCCTFQGKKLYVCVKGLPSPISYHPAWTFFPSCGLTAKIIGENLKSFVWGIQWYWVWMHVSEQRRSQDLLHASTYQVACGITSAHSLNSPRRLLAGSVFISFHFWKVPLKKILTLKKNYFLAYALVFW